MVIDHPEVFLSYAWGGESEKIVNELDGNLQSQGLTLIRDKRDIGFKGLITDFMKKIGTGKAVVIVISDKYLRSPYCMFELMMIYRNHDFNERIFPVFLEDAALFDPKARIAYAKYWIEKKSELGKVIGEFGPDAVPIIGDDYTNYNRISNNIGEVLNNLKDVNALNPEMHRVSKFEALYRVLLQRLEEDTRYTKQNDTRKLLNQLSRGS